MRNVDLLRQARRQPRSCRARRSEPFLRNGAARHRRYTLYTCDATTARASRTSIRLPFGLGRSSPDFQTGLLLSDLSFLFLRP